MPAMPANKTVVHDKHGKIIKGTTVDFLPKKPVFHLSVGGMLGEEVREILVDDLKALFFVKTFAGDKNYNEIRGFIDPPGTGKRVKITFEDGEVIFGYTNVINFDQLGLSCVPADKNSNNERIFAVFSSVATLEIDGSPVHLRKMRNH